MRPRPTHRLLFLTAALFTFADISNAQSQRGQLAGRITDSTGAAVPQAKVQVLQPETGLSIEAESNGEGLYSVPFLQYGVYRVRISKTGFAVFDVTKVEIAAASTTTVDASLSLSANSSEVTVQANTTGLQTESSTVATSVDEKLKNDVPNVVNGSMRNAFSYIYMSAGVNATGQLTIAGGRTFSTEALIDGQSLDMQSFVMGGGVGGGGGVLGGGTGGLPSVEAIGEYKLLTNSMAAEYGRSSGGEITFATKSGTNQYHGVAYEYLRNQVLDARSWQAASRSPLKQNEFGFAGGGPVSIPRIYNGTNKTFFWANITGFKLRTVAAAQVLSLPTAAMKKGDFSAGDLNPIYDTLSPYAGPNGQTLRAQFPNNMIPASRLSAVSSYFLNLLPNPNLPGSTNNFAGTTNNTADNWAFSLKLDQYLGNNNRISGFYQFDRPKTASGSILGPVFGSTFYDHLNRPRLDWTATIRPNVINQFLFGFTRYSDNALSNNTGMNLGQKAGLRGTYDADCPEIYFPGPNWYICGNAVPLGGHPSDTHGNLITTLNDSVLWNHGAHTVKAGFQLIHWNENSNTLGGASHGSATGQYTYQDSATGNTDSTGGNMWASFYLGYPSAVSMQAPFEVGVRQSYYALFVQDDWKVSRKLTINAGLRWDVNVPYAEVHGQVTAVDRNLPNPAAGNLPGALTFYGSGSGRNGIDRPGEILWKNFGPRLGLAYLIDSKTVFRAFSGIVYQGAQSSNGLFADRTGFQGGGSPVSNANPFGLYYQWDTPYPQNVLGVIPNTDPTFRNGQAAVTQSPQYIARAPAEYMWSGGFQRQIKGNILLEATYLANMVKHENDKLQLDELNPRYWGLGALLNQPLNSPQVQALGYTAPFPGFNASLPLYRALLPYPQYNGLTDNANSWSSSSYHAAMFKAEKRYSSGLVFMVNYTVSKTISYSSFAPGQYGSTPRDAYNFALSKALGRYDIPQRLVVNYSYELPFGPGRRYLNKTGGIGKQVLGGWILSGIHQYQAGVPLTAGGALATAIPTVSSRADRVVGVPVRSKIGCSSIQFRNPASDYIFNAGNPTEALRTGRPLAYQSEGAYGFGNDPVVEPNARQCGTENEDVSINKTFFVREKLNIRFGLDAFNVLNRHTWQVTSTTITASDFGEVVPYQVNGPRHMQFKLRIEF